MIQYLYLGRMGYEEALRLQEELVALRQQGRIENTLLLLEHPPVLTLGRNANRSNVLASDELLAARGVTLHEIKRGGDVTYHGPGQLIGYPIFDLRSLRNAQGRRLGPVDFVRQMEEALIRVCGTFGVRAGRVAGLTGVWCAAHGKTLDEGRGVKADDPPQGERKIAAIGIHVSRGVVSHGFAFNVRTDLRDFQLINPCGITDRPGARGGGTGEASGPGGAGARGGAAVRICAGRAGAGAGERGEAAQNCAGAVAGGGYAVAGSSRGGAAAGREGQAAAGLRGRPSGAEAPHPLWFLRHE
jgi:lipoyl(octanoyl) transferase